MTDIKKPMLLLAVIGVAGLSLIKSSEGLVYKTYRDPIGIITACYGHTGPELRMGMLFTKAQCDAILVNDIKAHRNSLAKCVTAPITQNQSDAMVSLAFNIGVPKMCKSSLVRYVNQSNYGLAASEFSKWDKARLNGRLIVLKGLHVRRTAERELFLTRGAPAMPNAPSGAVRGLQSISP